MTENNFWTSEQRLLTTNRKKFLPLTSPKLRICCSPGTGPDPHHLREEKTEEKKTLIGLSFENPLASE
jgi:hypothetical protein